MDIKIKDHSGFIGNPNGHEPRKVTELASRQVPSAKFTNKAA
jgi:hypothetical protein